MKARQWKSATQPLSQSDRMLGWAIGHVTLLLGLLIVAAVLLFFGQEALRPVVTIEVVAVPKVMQEAGLSAEIVTRHVLDRIEDVESDNFNTGLLAKPKSFRDGKELELPAYEIPGFQVSTRDVIKILRRSLGREPTTVGISVSQTDERKFQLQIRVHPSGGQGQTLVAAAAVETYGEVAERIALSILRQFDPVQLANMLYSTKGTGYADVLQSCIDGLEREKKVQCLVAWGDIESDGEHDTRAQRRYKQALDLQAEVPEALTGQGYVEEIRGNLAGARELYLRAKVAGLVPQLVHMNEAHLRHADGELGGAAWELQQASSIGKPNAALLVWLASVQHENGKAAEATKTILKAMDADSRRAATMSAWANMLVDDGRVGEGMEKIEAARRLMRNTEQANVQYEIGAALRKKGYKKQAVLVLKRAVDLAPESSFMLRALASAEADMEGSGKDEAIRLLNQAIEQDPEDWRARNLLGDTLDQTNHKEAAIAQWRKAIALNPYGHEAPLSLGYALLRSGDPAGAERQFRTAQQLAPKSRDTYLAIGIALAAEGHLSDALEAVMRAPGKPDLVASLVRAVRKQEGRKMEDAYADAEVILRSAEQHGYDHGALSLQWGWIYYIQNRLEKAEQEFRAAIKYPADEASARFGLSETLYHRGNYAAARIEVDTLERLTLGTSWAAELRNLIDAQLTDQAPQPPARRAQRTARADATDVQGMQ